jgi:hypothetical protein
MGAIMQLSPGLYRLPVTPVRPIGALTRGDVAVLVGYCRKGPAGVPVRLQSLGEFEDLFGAALEHGFLWHGVKGFFENGGQTAYGLRVISAKTRAARAQSNPLAPAVPGGLRLVWRATASFPWLLIDPRKQTSALEGGSASWIQTFEQVVADGGVRVSEPGAFGNSLVLKLTRTARVRTETTDEVIDGGSASSVRSLAGLEAGSILELTQTDAAGATRSVVRLPGRIDAARQRIVWSQPLSKDGFVLRRPIRISSVEFDLAVFADGKLQQSFAALSPNPAHSRAMAAILPAACRAIDFSPIVVDADGDDAAIEPATAWLKTIDWADRQFWPPEGDYPLAGGVDGLDEISAGAWLSTLPAIGRLADAAMIAAPDIVLPEASLAPPDPAAPVVRDCCVLDQPVPGFLLGRVISFDNDGLPVALAGVAVDVEGPGGVATTGDDGWFSVANIGLSLVSIRLQKPGYEPLEFQAQPFAFMPSKPHVEIPMVKVMTPKAFGAETIIALQTELSNPETVGPYKIAVIDPPSADLRADQLANWRSRLGDSARIGFFAPWITLPAKDRRGGSVSLACPPSGHVAGAFAAAEAATGIHRTGANLQLRYVEGVTLVIDTATQEGLNPIGVNAIRAFPGRGVRIFGTRSLSSDPEWRFLTTRRIVDAIEKTLEAALHWMVFEPNNQITRHSVQTTAAILLDRLFRLGVLSGTRAEGAYAAKCDLENNPATSRDDGKLVIDVAVAPTQPFEFIHFRLGHEFDAIQVTER